MDTELSQGLTFLTWTAGGFLIVVGVFVVKLLFDMSRLTVSLKKSAEIVRVELEPIMKNVNETTTTINNLVQSTNKKVSKFSEVYDKASDAVINVASKAAGVAGMVLKEVGKGLFVGFKSMLKRK